MIEEALEARVIEETEQAGRYRFTHAQMQETLLAELSTTRRVRLHGQVGEALEKRYGAHAEERAGRLAMHFSEAATLSPRFSDAGGEVLRHRRAPGARAVGVPGGRPPLPRRPLRPRGAGDGRRHGGAAVRAGEGCRTQRRHCRVVAKLSPGLRLLLPRWERRSCGRRCVRGRNEHAPHSPVTGPAH